MQTNKNVNLGNKIILPFLDEHGIGIRKHHWSHTEYDIVRPFYLLKQDPRYTLAHEVLDHLDLPQDFMDELNHVHVKPVAASCTQTIKDDPLQAQLFALEVQRHHKDKLVNLVQNHFPDIKGVDPK